MFRDGGGAPAEDAAAELGLGSERPSPSPNHAPKARHGGNLTHTPTTDGPHCSSQAHGRSEVCSEYKEV